MNILHSKIIGSGQPLIVLHGYFGMSDNWKTMGKKLSKNFEVHLLDQRNHGRSFHSDDFDYELMADDLYHYINHHKLNEVFLLGHSMGGKTAMLFAVNYPKIVKKLIIADISPRYYQPHHQFILGALNAVDFNIHNTRSRVENVLKGHIKENGIVQFLLKNVYWKSKNELAFRFNLQSLTENNEEVGAAIPSLTQYDKPVLFLSGEKSDYISNTDIPLIEAHFPKAKIVTVKNAGHWLHAENPVQFYNEVMDFLTEI